MIFLFSLTTIRNTTQSNAIFTGPLTNYAFMTYRHEDYTPIFPRTYGGCNCGFSASCNFLSYIRAYATETTLFVIPGFYSACYTTESLLQSDLRCFYNQACIDELKSWFVSPEQRNITSLDSSVTSRFLSNTTFEGIIECTYTRQAKNNAVYIVTTLFGLTSGLTKAFRLTIPFLVKYTTLFIRKWKRRNTVPLPIIKVEGERKATPQTEHGGAKPAVPTHAISHPATPRNPNRGTAAVDAQKTVQQATQAKGSAPVFKTVINMNTKRTNINE
ncbi:unnamed protein product [Adineta ricciae]|uniref:Uncharacterized protein n=1 Tax=Adineta ricciae TaxID=249248 RepID=A0A816DLP9_ADIRI|nr:unnamed protein product [Adineta ricciae]CAF1638810.1 unnamed protein product [Adineta ricciae]